MEYIIAFGAIVLALTLATNEQVQILKKEIANEEK